MVLTKRVLHVEISEPSSVPYEDTSAAPWVMAGCYFAQKLNSLHDYRGRGTSVRSCMPSDSVKCKQQASPPRNTSHFKPRS